MRTRRPSPALLVAVMTLALLPMLSTMSPATADQVWYQSLGRASSDAPCEESSAEELATGWTSWAPSWAQWANNSAGGFVCNRQITWASDSVPPSDSGLGSTGVCRTTSGGSIPTACALGTYGPGGGLVFLISGGLTYEMAPKNWGVNETTGIQWCSDQTNPVTTGTAVGTGSANTTAMLTNASPFVACSSSAPNVARAYTGGGLTDWFLPSQDELNAMCIYSRNPTTPPGSCTGGQDVTFAAGAFGFYANGVVVYWTSSQYTGVGKAWVQYFDNGGQTWDNASGTNLVRPVRAF